MPRGSAIIARLDGQYQSAFFTDLSNSVLGQVSSRALGDLRLTWRSPGGDWQGTAAITNFADRFYYINKVFSQNPAVTQGQPGTPREWLLSVRHNF